jgi:hypothetical protein
VAGATGAPGNAGGTGANGHTGADGTAGAVGAAGTNGTVSFTSTTGDIAVEYDHFATGNTITANAGTGKATIAPFTPTTAIQVGNGATDRVDFGAENFTTGGISASTLQIGDANNTGGISVAGNFDPGFATLHLDTSGAISNAVSTNTVTAANLALTAGSGIGAGIATLVDATKLAAENTSSGNIVVTTAGSTSLDAVDGVLGVKTFNVNGNISVLSNGTLTVKQASTANGTGNTVLATTGGTANNIVLNAEVGTTTNAATTLTSTGNIQGTGIVKGSNVTLDSATGVGTIATRVNTQAATLAARASVSGGVFRELVWRGHSADDRRGLQQGPSGSLRSHRERHDQCRHRRREHRRRRQHDAEHGRDHRRQHRAGCERRRPRGFGPRPSSRAAISRVRAAAGCAVATSSSTVRSGSVPASPV